MGPRKNSLAETAKLRLEPNLTISPFHLAQSPFDIVSLKIQKVARASAIGGAKALYRKAGLNRLTNESIRLALKALLGRGIDEGYDRPAASAQKIINVPVVAAALSLMPPHSSLNGGGARPAG